MQLLKSILLTLFAVILFSSSAFSGNAVKGYHADPAAKIAPATTIHGPVNHNPSGNLDDLLVGANFNDGVFPPIGWAQDIQNADFTWNYSTATLYEGAGATDIVYDPALSPQDEWLISPAVDMSNEAASYQISFWWMMSYYWGVSPNDNYDIELKISLNGGTSWEADILWSEAEQSVFESWEWYNIVVDVSEYAGEANVKFGFRYVGSDGAQAGLDLIAIEGTASGGNLTGTVSDDESSDPIEGVNVVVVGDGSSTSTNAMGGYQLFAIPSGTYVVEFTHPMYQTATMNDVVVIEGVTTTLNVSMTALPMIDNNDCDDPFVISDLGVYPFSTVYATSDLSIAELPAECDEGFGVAFAPDVWASWIAPGTGSASFSLCNDADYDTRMACYATGTSECPPCPTTNEFFHACNDDGDDCADFTSLLEFEVVAGACYLIRIGGFQTSVGSGNLTVSFVPRPLPEIAVTPNSLDFGSVELGLVKALTITVENTGGAPLSVTSIPALEGFTASPGAFALPGSSTLHRIVTVTFAPTAAQVYSGNIAIISNDPNSPTLIPVTGEGVILEGNTCANAIPIPFLPYCAEGSTVGYSSDYETCDYPLGGLDVVYSYTPAASITVSLSTCGSSQETYLYVHTGCATGMDSIECVFGGCSDGQGACLTGLLLTANTTYYFVVDHTDNYPGDFYRLAIQEGSECPDCDEILPVELLSFTASGQDRQITLNWSTASETNSGHFDILRDGQLAGQRDAANSPTGSSYSWVDQFLTNGTEYTYTLIGVDLDGARSELATVSATPAFNAPDVAEYALLQNYPNPFNPETQIVFDLAENVAVKLGVYNLLGQQVAELLNGSMVSGRHSIAFNGTQLPSGMYLYRLEAGEFSAQRKMILMK